MLERVPVLGVLVVLAIVAFAVAMLWLALTFNVPWAMGILLLVVVIGFWIVDHPDSYLRRRRAP